MIEKKVIPQRKSKVESFEERDWLHFRRFKCEFYEKFAPDSWKHILKKSLLYKKPHLVNAVNTRPDFYHSLFMVPAMFRVGRHEYVVRLPKERYDRNLGDFVIDGGKPDYMYFTNVSDIRPEDVHPFVKPSKSNKVVRRFVKEKSVFQPWKDLSAGVHD